MLAQLIKAADIENFNASDRRKTYIATFVFDVEKSPAFDYFLNIFQLIPDRDKIYISLDNEIDDVFQVQDSSIGRDAYDEYIEKTLKNEKIKARIEINKSVEANCLSVYDYDEFIKDLLSLSIEEVMRAFSGLFVSSPTHLVFDVFGQISIFTTRTMFFVPHGHEIINMGFNREKRKESCKHVSYFYNLDVYELLPDDFKVEIDYAQNPLSDLFHKITSLLSIGFIATTAALENGQIKGIINGQRTVEYGCRINDLVQNNVLYKIYNWIYTDGNAIDKAIIARNVISLHCRYVSIIDLDEKVIASIESNHRLYLKENVTQYLELKNKVAEFISDVVSKTGEYATELLDKFKTNLIAIFGFMFSVILANIVSSQPLDNLFTMEITVLLQCVIAGSIIYLIICYFQSKYEIEKVYESYDQLKKNYNNVLTEDDLKDIFDDDKLLDTMKANIEKMRKRFLILWGVFLFVCIIIVELLSDYSIFQIIKEIIVLFFSKGKTG